MVDSNYIEINATSNGKPLDYKALNERIHEAIKKGYKLNDFYGNCTYSEIVDTLDITPGSYYIQAKIYDTFGNLLDRRIDMLILGKPFVAIESISGGFGVSVVIENNGTKNLTDLKWSISIESNMTILGEYKEGYIDLLEPGDVNTIKSGFIIGFGPAKISINVAGVKKDASCFVIGPFILKVKEY